MKTTIILITFLFLCSCEKDYEQISEEEFRSLTVQDTISKNQNMIILKVGDSLADEYSRILVKSENYYLFNANCEVKNDSTILSYSPAFIIDSEGEFRKNGIWVYCEFYTEGNFPFHANCIRFSPDSIPRNWNGKLPTKEGIYLLKNGYLKMISNEQSEDKFKEKKINGFYFLPNKGRLFDKIDLKGLN
ncbi:hypothetical protein [Flavobacterium sp.]|jgi:hypothetical protein|uniref:hypothetical protein n=1 Tax=Flavobacterium sp. TaxID=239 RepID=UPI0022BB5B82|nr:hypothetical protein [Flavobacterium sp.]MCZ8145957.1 hypothetical protein [Flavobacterium sp.]MCZ8367745.1 hypothetical protein [Flavobacterium sp.]